MALGQRTGTVYLAGGNAAIAQANIRFRGAPTVTVNEYEIAIGRDTLPDGLHPLFAGNTVRIALRDNTGGDVVPNTGQTITYTLNQGAPPPTAVTPLDRLSPCDLRVVTYNVLFDSLFDVGQQDRFRRLLTAARPDIVLFQEIYDHTAAESAQLLQTWLPPPAGQSWHSAGIDDCQIISRYRS